LQASKDLKKENETLLGQLDDCRTKIEGIQQHAQRDKIALETELEEYKKLVPSIEEDHADLLRTKRQLELDNEGLHKRWSAANKQHKQDQAIIAQLNQRVRSSSVSSVGSPDEDTLDGEFSGLTEKQLKAGERASNVEKQNQELQSIASEQASKILSLQRLLDEANSRPKLDNHVRRLSFASDSPEKPAAAQGFGIPIINGVAQPAHSLFSIEDVQKLRARLGDEAAKRKEVDRQWRKTVQELDIVKKDRRSLSHRYMSIVEQHSNHLAVAYVALDKLEMVAQIRADNSEELKRVREINERLEWEHREQKDLLSKSIGYNATLQNGSKLVSQEIRDLTAAIKEGKQLEDSSPAVDLFSRMIMDSRKEIVETQKVHQDSVVPHEAHHPTQPLSGRVSAPAIGNVGRSSAPALRTSWLGKWKAAGRGIEQQKITIADLEKRLHDAEADAEAGRKGREEEQPPTTTVNLTATLTAELPALRAENANLKRELRLISSAFHDQASRLQLSDVTLRRRSEQQQQPASWLGRQRRSVVALGAGR
ncbi:MAG: hypothetical protein Q9177_002910, partial [Variospora cf. flavescens]